MTLFAGVEHLNLFVAAGILPNLTPGPDVCYIVTQRMASLQRGAGLMVIGFGLKLGLADNQPS